MILLQSDSVELASIVADKVLHRIAHFQQSFREEDIMFGASIGIGFTHNPTCRFEALLKAADKACYKAKNNGKDEPLLRK